MEIKIRTYYWNKDRTKILGQSNIVLTENVLLELIESRYIDGEYGIPMHLNKNEIIFESTIDEINIIKTYGY